MKDRVMVGAISGIAAQLTRLPITFLLIATHVIKYGDLHVAAGFFMNRSQVANLSGGVAGSGGGADPPLFSYHSWLSYRFKG